MTTLDYRPARADDRPAIEQMLARSFPPLLAATYEAALLADCLPALTRVDPRLLDCETWFVALADGELVGCGGWTREQPGSGELVAGLGHVRHFCTDVAHTRRGIGRGLGLHTIATARAAGLARLECAATTSAEDFYRSLGLRTLEHMTVLVPVLAQPGERREFPIARMCIEL